MFSTRRSQFSDCHFTRWLDGTEARGGDGGGEGAAEGRGVVEEGNAAQGVGGSGAAEGGGGEGVEVEAAGGETNGDGVA